MGPRWGLDPAREAAAGYKELSEMERAFAQLKDVIEIRPIPNSSDFHTRIRQMAELLLL